MQTIKSFLIESSGITGNNPKSCVALEELNLARSLLFRLDDWVGTIEYLCVNVGRCFHLPWHVETIRAAWNCNRSIEVGSAFYSEIGYNDACSFAGKKVPIIRTGYIDVTPVRIPKDSKIGFECTNENDKGKKCFVSFINDYGSITTEEIQLTEVGYICWGKENVRSIKSISKERTQGIVNVKAFNGEKFHVLSLYPQQLVSEFQRYTADGCLNCQVIIKAKKRYFPYFDEDLDSTLDFNSPEALRFAIKAIQAEKAGAIDKYAANLQAARTHLEREKEDLDRTSTPQKTPIQQIFYPSTSLSYGGWD